MSTSPNPEVAILNAALELPPSERAAYLDKACAGDSDLRRRVEELLQAQEEAGDFLEAPAAGLDAAKTTRISVPLAEKPGDKIGHYKLLQQIGEGGCGVVYMAEQEEPVRRRVALKVIKLGMDTKSVIARFEAERQALALMDHPNIAKVLDAGATETGRPYFVMELVRGVKITDFCDENKVPTQERLELFIRVCQAIQHAHQKGIIHRDIKPSNILVTINDGVAVPKVIDFGIAKATQGRLTDQTLFTAFEQFLGTPAYMSPEQAVMTSLDIDTRSDIYSLGVLLYELLTGKTPFEQKELLAAGLDEMRRTIREKEPPKPSTRLSAMTDDELTTTASRRQLEPPRLIHTVRGDLDWIVMKCLAKDRGRRYETANGLARDIERHLHHEPVTARPPSRLYEFRKTLRRHRVGFAAAGAVIAALAIGMAVSTLELVRARRAEREQVRLRQQAEEAQSNEARLRSRAETGELNAKTEAAKSQQVSEFLKDMLRSVDPKVALGHDTTILREILDKTTKRVNNDLPNQPEVEGELLNVTGLAYWSIREFTKAEAAFSQALLVQRKVLGDNHPNVADSLFGLGQVLDDEDRPEESEAAYREALQVCRKIYGNEHWMVAACLNNITGPLVEQGKFAEAEAFSRKALAMKRKLLTNDDPQVAISLRDLGLVVYHTGGNLAEAESLLSDGLTTFRKALGNDDPDVAFTLNALAGVLSAEGKLSDAEAAARKALAIQRKVYDQTSPDVAGTLNGLAGVLGAEGKLAEAEQDYQEALAIQRKLHPGGDKTLVDTLDRLVDILKRQGKPAQAEPLSREALATRRMLAKGTDNPVDAETLINRADTLRALGMEADAERAYQNALAICTKSGAIDGEKFTALVRSLLDVLNDENKPGEVEKVYQEVLAAQRSTLGNDSSRVAKTLFVFADFVKSQNRVEEAAQKYRESADIYLKPSRNEHLFKTPWDLIFRLVEVGEKQKATIICRAMLDSDASNAMWFNNASWAFSTAENPTNRDPALAVELAKRSVQIEPQQDWNTVAVAYYRAGDFKQALAWLRKTEQRAAGDDKSYDTFFLAMAEHQVGNADAARRYYAHAIQWMKEHDPNNPELLRFRTEAEQLLGSETNGVSENQFPAPTAPAAPPAPSPLIQTAQTTDEFWKTWDREQALTEPLRKDGFKYKITLLLGGKYRLSVQDQPLSDLSFLKDAPIEELILFNTSVSDLRPLTNVALTHLDIRMTKVTDLSPLRAPALSAGLRELDLWQIPATDFSPIAACTNLEYLDAAGTALTNLNVVGGRKLHVALLSYSRITNISTLAGMPLDRVTLAGTAVSDISPLLQCPTLTELVLPPDARDVKALHSLPALTMLSYDEPSGGYSGMTAEEFWKEHGDITAETVSALSQKSIQTPDDKNLALKVASLQAWFGLDTDYAATCKRVIGAAEGAPKTNDVREPAAKSWCLLPWHDVAMLPRVLSLAREAAKAELIVDQRPWYQQTLGMAEFRAGNDSAAETAFLKAEQASETGNWSPELRPYVLGPSRFFRAMILFRQGKKEDAEKLFRESEALMRPIPEKATQMLPSDVDQNQLLYWLAYKEAKALIEGLSAPLPEKSEPK